MNRATGPLHWWTARDLVAAIPSELESPTEVAGVTMPHYLGWMRVCSRITVSAHPVAAVPAGFTGGGPSVGMQLVGRYR